MSAPKHLTHLVSEDDGDMAMCGETVREYHGQVVDRMGRPFYFIWAADYHEDGAQEFVNCNMCKREWNKRNPAVLNGPQTH